MRLSLVELALAGAMAMGLAVGASRWVAATPAPGAPALPGVMGIATTPPMADDRVVGALLQRNPFRHSNRPARTRLGDPPASERAAVTRYRPTLTLKGIVGGPPWTAMVHGIPGRRGSAMLGVGERADSLLVRSIEADRIVLVGPDTTWVLTLGRDRP